MLSRPSPTQPKGRGPERSYQQTPDKGRGASQLSAPSPGPRTSGLLARPDSQTHTHTVGVTPALALISPSCAASSPSRRAILRGGPSPQVTSLASTSNPPTPPCKDPQNPRPKPTRWLPPSPQTTRHDPVSCHLRPTVHPNSQSPAAQAALARGTLRQDPARTRAPRAHRPRRTPPAHPLRSGSSRPG